MRASLVANIETRGILKIYRQSQYFSALKAVPEALLPVWRQTAKLEFIGIPQNALFFARSLEGLLTFFDCASRAGRKCGLPSRAADSVWHAWARMDHANLERFCVNQFGRPIPHVEAVDMRGGMGIALAVCLVEARRLASEPSAGPSLPRLFMLDRALKMPQGFGYKISGGLVAFSGLNGQGLPRGEVFYPDGLTPYGLFQAGLISEADYKAASQLGVAERASSNSPAGGSCGSVATDAGAAASCDGGGGDAGGCDGGSSCGGGSCGGGCGGGGCSS